MKIPFDLLSSWSQNGTDEVLFGTTLRTVTDHSDYIIVDPKEVSFINISFDKSEKDFFVQTYEERQTPLPESKEEANLMTKRGFRMVELTSDEAWRLSRLKPLFSEVRQTHTIAIVGRSLFGISEHALSMAAERAGIKASEWSPRRNEYLTEKFRKIKGKIKFLVRNVPCEFEDDKGNRIKTQTPKIFAVFTEKYSEIPMTILEEIPSKVLNGMGKAEMKGWSITHDITKAVWIFPELAEDIRKACLEKSVDMDLIPGAYIQTSDTGRSSFTVSGCWYVNGHLLYADGIPPLRHYGLGEEDKLIDKLIEDCDRHVFAKYRTLPDALCNLFEVDVPGLDIAEVIDNYIREMNLEDLLGKRALKSLREVWNGSFDPTKPTTLFDIVEVGMALADCIEDGDSSKSVKEKLQKSLLGMVYIKPEKVKAGSTEVIFIA